ncbi:MerR family transcriptional regulator [Photobacterium sp. CCB-ST2H9]|uniref:MerR family transcriptional regulator n=1 Tax=unclassified Photobacterium TaxID=2628852 RepID=UPI002003896E|nr:MerR family transcriptional regulator [Photobacterium sp. CCB-ST2H9]UTM60172.1 MerR family transcriptional regulator [Photobacterium sp. CCB-ST2H9]
MASEIQLFAIREVSELTGVNPVTLRAWQRRYGLIKPQRTEKGHRLYTREDIERIQLILSWLEKGVAISKVRPLLEGGMEAPLSQSEQNEWVEPVLTALSECRRGKLEQLLTQLMKEYPLPMFIENVVEPVDKQVKDPANPLSAIQKALWQSALIERCAGLISKNRKRNGKKALLLSFEPAQDGMTHTIWLAALAMSSEGDSVTILENLPFNGKLHGLEAAVAQQQFEKVVVMGESKLPQAILKQLSRLHDEFHCPVQLNGSIAVIHAGWQKPPTGVQNDGEQ